MDLWALPGELSRSAKSKFDDRRLSCANKGDLDRDALTFSPNEANGVFSPPLAACAQRTGFKKVPIKAS